MIPLALAAILEDVRGHPGARSLGVGTVAVSTLFLSSSSKALVSAGVPFEFQYLWGLGYLLRLNGWIWIAGYLIIL